jgi:hypothetical protein
MMSSAVIVQHLVADAFRGRVMGLFPLVLGLGMLSALPAGIAARATSLEAIVPALGWTTVALTLALGLTRPALRAVRPARVAVGDGEPAPPSPPLAAPAEH